MTRRILITGASGTLGYPLTRLAVRRATVVGTYFTNPVTGGGSRVRLDLRNREKTETLLQEFRPDVVIHTAVSDQSDNPTDLIPLTTRHISQAAQHTGARLISLSTDLVFDGTNPPYPEDAPVSPVNAYGQAKADAEAITRSIHKECLIVRTSLIYTFDRANRQISWIENAVKSGETVHLFTDEIRRPIWAWNLAQALLELAASEMKGILHVAGPERLSRWEYGQQLLAAVDSPAVNHIQPGLAADIAPHRPRDVSLDIEQATRILDTPLLTMQQAIHKATGNQGDDQPISTTTSR